jgi:hypothetical protein
MARLIQLILSQGILGSVIRIHAIGGNTARHTLPEATMCASFSPPSLPSARSKIDADEDENGEGYLGEA